MGEPFNPNEQVLVWWADLLLWQAAKYATDNESWWAQTQPQIMATFHIAPDDYWDMTVADHARLAAAVGQFTEPEVARGEP